MSSLCVSFVENLMTYYLNAPLFAEIFWKIAPYVTAYKTLFAGILLAYNTIFAGILLAYNTLVAGSYWPPKSGCLFVLQYLGSLNWIGLTPVSRVQISMASWHPGW